MDKSIYNNNALTKTKPQAKYYNKYTGLCHLSEKCRATHAYPTAELPLFLKETPLFILKI